MTAILVGIFLAVLNSLWQAAFAAAIVWAALKLLAKVGVAVNAATRYGIWWVVLAVVLALPIAPRLKLLWPAHAQPSSAAADPLRAPRVVTPLAIEPPVAVLLPAPKSAQWPWWIFGLGAAVFVYRLDQIARSYFYLRGMKRRAAISAQPMPPAARPVRLLLSREVTSPMAVGFLHPAVVLPDSLMGELSAPELEHVLMHEVAHIARRDDWTNLAARLLGGALALHPVAWWILRQIGWEREIACDDWVVARTGSLPGNARAYAQSLARLSELKWARKEAVAENALASGIFGGGSRMVERIELLLRRGREFSGRVSRARVVICATVLLGFVIAGSLAPRWVAFAQQAAPMRFEVASIKPSAPGSTRDLGGIRAEFLAGGFRGVNIGIKNLIEIAYRGSYFEISGGPAWIDPDMLTTGDRYSIEAKAVGEASEDQVRRMLQTLLKERFKFQFHREARAQTVYDLVTAKVGPRLQEVHVENYTGDARMGGGRVITEQMTMRDLAEHLAGQVRSSVTDKTGLAGVYKFTLQWTPANFRLQGAGAPPAGGEPGIDADGPSLFTALQEQLGLKLEPVKGSVDVLVIDRVEKPDAN